MPGEGAVKNVGAAARSADNEYRAINFHLHLVCLGVGDCKRVVLCLNFCITISATCHFRLTDSEFHFRLLPVKFVYYTFYKHLQYFGLREIGM